MAMTMMIEMTVVSAKVSMGVVSAKVVHMAVVSAKVAHVMVKVSMGVVTVRSVVL